jgi:hypothetical protein
MSKFMLILHSSPKEGGFRNLSPDEIQGIIEKFRAWTSRLTAAGKMISGEKLAEEGGKVVSKQSGRVAVVDGPFSETKEVVGGYFLIRAENYDEAVELVRDCPGLAFGRIAIRQVDPISGTSACVLPASEQHGQGEESEVRGEESLVS